MTKPPKKTREEQTSENFFRVDQTDLANSTEKQVKEFIPDAKDILKKSTEKRVLSSQPVEEIIKRSVEKSVKKPSRRDLETVEESPIKKRKGSSKKKKNSKKKKKTKTGKSSKVIKFAPKEIPLNPNGYELIITEKPQAALKIATALGDATQRVSPQKVNYYEVKRNKEKLVVACAVGHLFTLTQKAPGSFVPNFEIEWVPNYLAIKKDFTKRYYDTLMNLIKGAKTITIATDFDVEGEVIGMNVVRFIAGKKDAQRMNFSTLTKEELEKSYDNKKPTLNWGHAIAGESRHYLDWFYGINLSRALMNAIKSTGKFRIMSIGRVQGPTLKLIVDKELEIQKFVSQDYFQVLIDIKEKNKKVELKYIKDIFDKNELKEFENIVGKKVDATTIKKEQILPPNPPFNLTSLQTECYKFYGITPSNTLKAAQSLYLAGLISYPRTSSEKLPEAIGYKEILKKLAAKYNVEHLIKKQTPIEGKKTDPAHPSIYPTGNFQVLQGPEEKVYNLIVKRFLSLFCEDAIIDKKLIKAKLEDKTFTANGSQTRKKAWLEIYPSKTKEVELPDVFGEKEILNSKIEEKQTQPPKRYSPASILSELEKRNLGTKATRAAILETLYDRGYIKEKSIEATAMGISLIKTLQKYSPIIIDEELTKTLQDEMDEIVEAKDNFNQKEDKIIDTAKKTIIEIAKDFQKFENKIGAELVEANINQREQQKKDNELCICPLCKSGKLAITYSRKNRRFFIACNAYPNCKNTYSLPPNGNIKKTEKLCEECGFPMLMSLRAGKKPWMFCFNKNCETNKKRLEEYYKKKEEEQKNSVETVEKKE